ncbi:uncharacterized protein B0H18DRAFT_1118237 [Fomitopsis serialis]|uniref:uncharacterized protein n=1 Tax=Fomitopsis serialis TaxID=139415 RepID=UPI002007CA9A|nr:uncharacterized protein B0H18DRAFT_1118237 [Neoantrodia serialis]KAH9927711.1 hypothetical protein B0H18DRAFT_1118237 [Neoantrodia serialis]
MPPPDTRVHDILDSYLPPMARLRSNLLRCTVYRDINHLAVISLDDTPQHHIGTVFGVCTQPAGRKCVNHLKAATVQMSDDELKRVRREVAELEPPPEHHGGALYLRAELPEEDGDPPIRVPIVCAVREDDLVEVCFRQAITCDVLGLDENEHDYETFDKRFSRFVSWPRTIVPRTSPSDVPTPPSPVFTRAHGSELAAHSRSFAGDDGWRFFAGTSPAFRACRITAHHALDIGRFAFASRSAVRPSQRLAEREGLSREKEEAVAIAFSFANPPTDLPRRSTPIPLPLLANVQLHSLSPSLATFFALDDMPAEAQPAAQPAQLPPAPADVNSKADDKKVRQRTDWTVNGLDVVMDGFLKDWNNLADTKKARRQFHARVLKDILPKWTQETDPEEAIYNYFKNHGGKASHTRATTPDDVHINSKDLFAKSRAKGPSELWAEVPENKARIMQNCEGKNEVGAGGRQAATRRALFEQLLAEEKAIWEEKARAPLSCEAQEAAMARNREALTDRLSALFQGAIGDGANRVGDAVFYCLLGFNDHRKPVQVKHIFAGNKLAGQTFPAWGAPNWRPSLNDGGNTYTTPQQPAEELDEIDDGLLYEDGRPMLPSWGADMTGRKAAEILWAFFRGSWARAHRGVPEVPVLAPEAITLRLLALEWPAPIFSDPDALTVVRLSALCGPTSRSRSPQVEAAAPQVEDAVPQVEDAVPQVEDAASEVAEAPPQVADERAHDNAVTEPAGDLAMVDNSVVVEGDVDNDGRTRNNAMSDDGSAPDDETAKTGNTTDATGMDEDEEIEDEDWEMVGAHDEINANEAEPPKTRRRGRGRRDGEVAGMDIDGSAIEDDGANSAKDSDTEEPATKKPRVASGRRGAQTSAKGGNNNSVMKSRAKASKASGGSTSAPARVLRSTAQSSKPNTRAATRKA